MSKDNPASRPHLVRELMTVGVVTCAEHTSIRTIAQAILEKDVEAVVVLAEDGHALGIVGQDELVKAYASGSYDHLTAHEIMSDGIPQVPPDIPINIAAQLMQDKNIRIFYLTHHAGGIEYPAAVISYKHFLRHLQTESIEKPEDLGIDAARKSPIEIFQERLEEKRKQNQNIHLE
ncbi:MAG: CBS domain-containing protein [Anaerolineales bacterium]|nr:CBS domain-containing protein [Anaerolineales bacterium]